MDHNFYSYGHDWSKKAALPIQYSEIRIILRRNQQISKSKKKLLLTTCMILEKYMNTVFPWKISTLEHILLWVVSAEIIKSIEQKVAILGKFIFQKPIDAASIIRGNTIKVRIHFLSAVKVIFLKCTIWNWNLEIYLACKNFFFQFILFIFEFVFQLG